MAESPDGSLDGRTYVSTATSGGATVPGATIRLVFVDGLLVVSGGCNSMRGTYELVDDVLAVPGPMASTMMACADELMALDQWLATSFEHGVDATFEGERLTLRIEDAVLELSLVPD